MIHVSLPRLEQRRTLLTVNHLELVYPSDDAALAPRTVRMRVMRASGA